MMEIEAQRSLHAVEARLAQAGDLVKAGDLLAADAEIIAAEIRAHPWQLRRNYLRRRKCRQLLADSRAYCLRTRELLAQNRRDLDRLARG